MRRIANHSGFTLIEVMIAILILGIGISAMVAMQVQAIKGNQTAFYRTDANAVALSVLEELKRLPFDDPNLDPGADLDAGRAPSGGAPNPAAADHLYTPANFPALSGIFQVSGTDLITPTGKRYQLFWNVLKPSIVIGGDTFTPYCTIRLFVYWDAMMGTNSICMTTIKFNNLET